MKTPAASIIMRSFNEAWALRETLPALRSQTLQPYELIVIDSGSTDGSQDLIRAAQPDHFIQIEPQDYNPSRVMNNGMSLARSENCIFLNADATPQHDRWLSNLVLALQQPGVGAVFGRQIPRPDCEAVFACDYDRCFGPNRESARWDHFFSMVSSGLRARVWADLGGFREDLQYAEDDDYTRRCKALGWAVRYVPDSVVMHSHNYTAEQARKRAFGDAKAIGQAWSQPTHSFNWLRTVLLGSLSDLRHDFRFCLQHRRLRELPHAMQIRIQQRLGRWQGFQAGLDTKGNAPRAKSPKGSGLRAQYSTTPLHTSP